MCSTGRAYTEKCFFETMLAFDMSPVLTAGLADDIPLHDEESKQRVCMCLCVCGRSRWGWRVMLA